MRHLFRLPNLSQFDKKDRDAIYASYEDLRTMGMCRFPYQKITIAAIEDTPMGAKFDDDWINGPIEFQVDLDEQPLRPHQIVGNITHGFDILGLSYGPVGKPKKWVALGRGAPTLEEDIVRTFIHDLMIIFIVLLSTRNIVKETRRNKLAKFGVGKQKHEYVTTLKIGKITEYEYEDGTPTGRHVRAHLRRGHIRHQSYGPEHAFHRTIFIEPVFVNSDREFVPRDAYNVTGLANAGFRSSKADLRAGERSGVLGSADGAGDRQDQDRHPPR